MKDIRYYYDAAGKPVAIRAFTRTSSTANFTDTIYYLQTNLQGDVVGIYNASGTKIYEYAYDAWGNIIKSAQVATGGSDAHAVNPFRYRGYYYDTETGFYYLQSRYYNPEWGRFLNADFAEVIGNESTLTDKNLYAYCDNNPVMRSDADGEFWISALIKVGIGVGSQYIADVVSNAIAGKTGWDIFVPSSTVGEYISAGVTALIPGSKITSALLRSVVSEGIQSVERKINGEENSWIESSVSIFNNTIMDYGFSTASDWVDGQIHKLEPMNYSSYAGMVRKKNPDATRSQITRKLGKRITATRFLQNSSSVAFDLTNSIAGKFLPN